MRCVGAGTHGVGVGGSELALCDLEGVPSKAVFCTCKVRCPRAAAGLLGILDPHSCSLSTIWSRAEPSRVCGRRPGRSPAEGDLPPHCMAGNSLMDPDLRGPLGG